MGLFSHSHPLGMPAKSVRALLAIIALVFWFSMQIMVFEKKGEFSDLPPIVNEVTLGLVGYYIVRREGASAAGAIKSANSTPKSNGNAPQSAIPQDVLLQLDRVRGDLKQEISSLRDDIKRGGNGAPLGKESK